MPYKNRNLLLMVVGSLVTAGAVLDLFAGHYTNAQRTQAPGEPPPQARFKPGPIRVVEIDEPEWRESVSLQTLFNESRVIVVGNAIGNKCQRSEGWPHVTTVYEINVDEVIKGNIQPDTVIPVRMPGGLIMNRDGSILNVRADGLKKMENGKTYVLFLKNAPGVGDWLAPLRGSQGLYEVSENGRMIHLGRSSGRQSAEEGKEFSVFLEQLREMVGDPKLEPIRRSSGNDRKTF